jgi:hypothetical protein
VVFVIDVKMTKILFNQSSIEIFWLVIKNQLVIEDICKPKYLSNAINHEQSGERV